jgi:hypothetical protein
MHLLARTIPFVPLLTTQLWNRSDILGPFPSTLHHFLHTIILQKTSKMAKLWERYEALAVMCLY